MSFAYRGEKIFNVQDPKYTECGPPEVKRSDHRLKRFYSNSDKRAWDYCEVTRYKHFYEIITGSKTCLSSTPKCHQYVPLEDLINIIMAEKEARIKELEEMLRKCCGDQSPSTLESEESDNSEHKSRELLRQAMHKLQNIDEIINENKKLHCRLRCSEEKIKYLEEKKNRLENELADLRSKSQIEVDLERAQLMLSEMTRRERVPEPTEIAQERDRLQEKVNNLERELQEFKKKENEIEMLRNRSKSDVMNMEEVSKENECYRKKLASMKCLEKQILEIKKQGLALADKYKRESQKAAEQSKKMCHVTRELQSLREEREGLLKRVEELASHEGQLKALQCKLKRVDAIIAENEALNNKLIALDKLEKENEYLRCRLDQIQEMEMSAIDDKERILQLQCAVADQEEEMKDLLCQIERLTSGRAEEELERLKCELYDKNSKLKLCEEQLAEIPMLEAEIDDLRRRLQCCCKEFSEKKISEHKFQKIKVRLPSQSTGIAAVYKNENQETSSVLAIRKEEKVDFDQGTPGSCKEIFLREEKVSRIISSANAPCREKENMSCEDVQNLLQSSKGIISCVLEDMIEHHKEMEDLELYNRAMKNEIEILKSKVGQSDTDALLCEIKRLKVLIEEKDLEICRLQKGPRSPSVGRQESDGENSRENLMERIGDLEKVLQLERKARCQAERMLKEKEAECSSSAVPGRVTEEDVDFDCCRTLQREIDDLKLQIKELNNLACELKKENELLRELQQPCPDFSKELDEKCALENLLSLLQAELDTFKGQRLSEECEALRNELKRVMEQNCQLKILIDCYRQRLDLEKKSNALSKDCSEVGKKKLGVDVSCTGEEVVPPRSESRPSRPQEIPGPQELARPQEIPGPREVPKPQDLPSPQDQGPSVPGQPSRPQDLPGAQEPSAPQEPSRPQEPTPIKTEQPSTTRGEADCKDILDELNRLRKQVEEKDKAMEDMIKSHENDMKKLQSVVDKANEEKKSDTLGGVVGNNTDDDCQKRLRELEQQNADKLKKLMEQHEKELANQEKACNDNLNAMKAGYETDIRKMAEKHKASIMKLQTLHEDEVNELNTNHESQLETMQTQSEMAMKDIARGSAAKLKKLSQQHDKEIKVAEEKISRLQGNLAKSKEEIEELRKDATNDAAGKMTQMKEAHSRELQKVKKSSAKRLSLVTSKYEGLLAEEKRKSAAQLDTVKQSMGGPCECDFAKKKTRKFRDPTCPLDFNEVLEKILDQGINSLTFNEIALVHKKSCCALKDIVMKSKVTSVLEPPVGEVCANIPLLQAEKEQLLQRICALENEIHLKQRQTQEAILDMELSIKKERCRLQELKAALQCEQQKNSELKLLLSSQTKLQADLREEKERLAKEASLHRSASIKNSKLLNQEIKDKKYLETEVDRLKMTVQKLCCALEAEKQNSRCSPGKEASYLQIMKVKLEQSANRERSLALRLQDEVKCRMELQCRLQAARQPLLQPMVNLPAVDKETSENPLELKSVKEKKNFDQMKERKNKGKTVGTKKQKK